MTFDDGLLQCLLYGLGTTVFDVRGLRRYTLRYGGPEGSNELKKFHQKLFRKYLKKFQNYFFETEKSTTLIGW